MQHFLRYVAEHDQRYHFSKHDVSAASLEELNFLLNRLDHADLEDHFHADGNHFAGWIQQVIGDEELAEAVKPLHDASEIIDMISRRIEQIKQPKVEPPRPTISLGADEPTKEVAEPAKMAEPSPKKSTK